MHHVNGGTRLFSRLRNLFQVAAVAVLASTLGGCATNITGFDFPRFGLTKKEKGEGALAPGQQQPSSLSQQQ